MGKRSYKQLNWTSRIKLETMLKHGHSKKEIAEELGVHISTVYRELKRGTYEHLNSDYTTEERYSPEIAEARYQEGLSAKGAPLKIGKNHAAAQFIEDKIGNEDYSPAAVCALLKKKEHEHFGITFAVRRFTNTSRTAFFSRSQTQTSRKRESGKRSTRP